MLIRQYTPADLDALRRMHASQGFDYPFPDLSDPIFISKLVVEDDDGRPVMAALARLTCEMYLLVEREDERQGRGARGEGRDEKQGLGSSDDGGVAMREPSASYGDRESTLTPHPSSPIPLRRAGNSRADASARSHSPRERWAQLLALHRAGERDLLARGLDDAHAWLPPQIAKRFGRRLESLGWLRDDAWTPYCKRLVP